MPSYCMDSEKESRLSISKERSESAVSLSLASSSQGRQGRTASSIFESIVCLICTSKGQKTEGPGTKDDAETDPGWHKKQAVSSHTVTSKCRQEGFVEKRNNRDMIRSLPLKYMPAALHQIAV